MTGPAAPLTEQDPDPGRSRPPGPGIGRAAALIAGLTVAARLLGLVRYLVFARTVGAACLGTAYVTANQVPNIIYDIILGGALASIMVPVLARPAEHAARDPDAAGQVTHISSALLTWTFVILAPASLIIAVLAGPIASVLNPGNPAAGCLHADMVAVTGRMLTVFAPQILLYGLAVVLYGILQAHRRFTAPALAPVVSSLVVIAAYLIFVPVSQAGFGHLVSLGELSSAAELTLSAGTTLGVAALVVTALVAAWRLRLRVRPALRFPAGIAPRARGLAMVGIAALVAQDASVLVVIWLANRHGAQGALVLYNYAWQVFVSAYAVLAIPIAVSAFPVLSARDGGAFDDTAAGTARAVLLMSWLGASCLAAAAVPAARIFASHPAQVPQLARGLAAFAPGLVGYGIVACLSRVLLADGRNKMAAAAMSGGWLAVIGADVIAVSLVPRAWVVPALGLGNTAGMSVSAVALVLAVRRARGARALRGAPRAAWAGLAAALAGAAAGAAAAAAVPASGRLADGGVAGLAAACAAAGFGAVAYALDGGDLRLAVARIRRRAAP
ncbi:MAG TPA: lipid II flippase MurJ [Streptosporangiaceae bacterium]|nr:lipid II flippase MurJ [Streptosporangiaceae bacterium]